MMTLEIFDPKCESITCPDISAKIRSGEVVCSQNLDGLVGLGKTCEVKCAAGYKPVGQKLLKCMETGKYDSSVSRCQRIPASSASACREPQFNPDANFQEQPKCLKMEVKYHSIKK